MNFMLSSREIFMHDSILWTSSLLINKYCKNWQSKFMYSSGYRTTRGFLNLTPHSTTSCNVAVSNARRVCSRLGRNIVNTKGKPNPNCSPNANP